jgi:hypothetical protein
MSAALPWVVDEERELWSRFDDGAPPRSYPTIRAPSFAGNDSQRQSARGVLDVGVSKGNRRHAIAALQEPS